VIQGYAVDPYTNELFTLHVSGLGVGALDNVVINQFEADGRKAQTSYRYTNTPSTTLGHQELDISWDKDGNRWFWSGENERISNAARYVRRFQVSNGAGDDLTISNEGQYKLWTDEESSGQGSSTVAISLDGRFLITENNSNGTTVTIKIFNAHQLMDGGPGDYSASQAFKWTFTLDTGYFPVQSIACDGGYVYVFIGNTIYGDNLQAWVFTLSGTLVLKVDDFVIGEAEALADPGANYEMEGAGWIYIGGQPFLSVSIASGEPGARKNRIWAMGAELSVTSCGVVNKPAFIAIGPNDYAVPDGEVMRLGHYSGDNDTFTEGASITVDNEFAFPKAVDTTFTMGLYDATTGGNQSATTATGNYVTMGQMVWIDFFLENIDITGMTAGNNAYFRGHNLTADGSAVIGPASVNNYDLPTGDYFNVIAQTTHSTDYIIMREMRDSAANLVTNVSQLDGANVRISGWFKKTI
jgi:hypothetical protein